MTMHIVALWPHVWQKRAASMSVEIRSALLGTV